MLSRRNIRIKVMQMLYTMSRDKELTFEEVLINFRKNLKCSFELYLFNLLQLLRVAEYARKDAGKRASKHLPTEEDKKFTSKLFDNDLTQSLVNNDGLKQLFKEFKLEEKLDDDTVRRLYKEFSKTPEYKAYLGRKEDSPQIHKNILLGLYKSFVSSESFCDEMEDSYSNWLDDKSLVVGSMKKTIKGLPASEDFHHDYRPTTETTVDFGEVLIKKVYHEDEELLNIIEPTLKNWDVDRVAVIDMILLKMALSELISFPTIPTKVTLNEFVEISKLYSTDKSKDFINGILDRLMKQLHEEGKIKKEGRGLVE